jgi:hypothetical protein
MFEDSTFNVGLICGLLLSGSPCPRWHWRDFFLYVAVAIATVVIVGVPVWMFSR